MMVRSCQWNGTTVEAWDVDFLPKESVLPEELRRAILGARQGILFVEGTENSLDVSLYCTLFSEISIVALGSCAEVIRTVTGLRDCMSLHHVHAIGLVDKDDRTDIDRQSLSEKGIFTVDVCSVESLYFCSDALSAVARRQAESLGCDANSMIREAQQVAIANLQPCVMHQMAARRCERQIRSTIVTQIPGWKELGSMSDDLAVTVCVGSIYQRELERLREYIGRDDYDSIVARYPLKQSRVLSDVAKCLRCRSKHDYEQMVVARIKEDPILAQQLRSRMRQLSEYVENSLPQ